MNKVMQAWQEITIKDLFFAFRKAKADCFFERSICIASEFAKYENNLTSNLKSLLIRLQKGDIDKLLLENLGGLRIVAKKLSSRKKDQADSEGHGFFSDPARAFERMSTTHVLIPEFRIVGDFPIEMHLLSALWINLVGDKFDAVLSEASYGSRLRRYRPEPDAPDHSLGKYHLEAIGSFQPYFTPYKKWRNQGFHAIRRELEAKRDVIAISMDFSSFYHRIDPIFLTNKEFLDNVNIELNNWELNFTDSFVSALTQWSEKVVNKLKESGCSEDDIEIGGIPIGLSFSRVVANVLLAGLDRDIKEGLTPIYYGRYVDDLFLVLHDPGNLDSPKQILDFIAGRTKSFPHSEEIKHNKVYLEMGGFLGKTTLLLQQEKQKVFFLNGDGGLDLLRNVEAQIRSVSSERRLMPSPDRLESMASAKVLTAAGHPSEEVDTLRRADGLSVRRLGWSIQLRAVETLERDLQENDWIKERSQFYRFAYSHIIRPDRILDHLDYLPRLMSLAVALSDWAEASRLINATKEALFHLRSKVEPQNIKINGCVAKGPNQDVWDKLNETITDQARDALLRSLKWNDEAYSLSEKAINTCKLVGLPDALIDLSSDTVSIEMLGETKTILDQALLLRESDWAKISYKDHLKRYAKRQRPAIPQEEELHNIYDREEDLEEFLKSSIDSCRINPCIHKSDTATSSSISLLPYLFPTRPYTTQEVSLYLPSQCIYKDGGNKPEYNWARYVRAIRGVWVLGTAPSSNSSDDISNKGLKIARIGTSKGIPTIRLAISSLFTSDKSFDLAASGRSDLSRDRYKRIESIVNQAIDANPRPTHLLLPELSLPERWINTVSRQLQDAGINLIAGLDYSHISNDIISEVVLVLADDRLGFPASVQIRQQKSYPAPGEEEILLRRFGKRWKKTEGEGRKPIYIHSGFCFGILVCSELQNISHRQLFQGQVDCLMVLSWNQDLETFSALVESASLDVHAHVALVNNRKYGDSRVRTPAKEMFRRDVCRLRGGENDHVVVVELEVSKLRSFQSRDKRWPREDDPYKPVPEGYAPASFRRTIPL